MDYQQTARRLFGYASLLLCWGQLTAQDQAGIALSNFSGSHGFHWNPASAASGPLRWDVGLFNAHAFAANNYAYFPQSSLTGLSDHTPNVAYYDNARYRGAVLTDLRGPSFMARIQQNHVIGFFTSVQTYSRVTGADADLGYLDYENLPVGQIAFIDPFEAATMVWSEIGLHYSGILMDGRSGRWSFGVNLRYLQGAESAFADNGNGASISKNQDGSLSVDNLELELAYAGNPGTGYEFGGSRGTGIGADFGLEFRSPDDRDGREPNRQGFRYGWKFGVALVDVGWIRYREDAQVYRFAGPFGSEQAIFDDAQFENVETLSEAVDIVAAELNGQDSASAVQTADRFSMGLPAGITLSADRHLGSDFYLAAMVVRPLPAPGHGISRTPVIAVVPRYERKFFEAAAAVSWVDDEDFRMGLSMRLGWLTVGTDDLLSAFVPGDLDGADAYVGLKINDFSFAGNGNRRNRGTGCPAFNAP